MATRLQLRRDTAANWTSSNPTLAQGELGVETDTKKAKFGDGSTPWTSLTYWSPQDLSSYLTATSTSTLTNKTLQSPEEITTVSATAATGTVNFDAVTQGVLYYTTNASGNWTLNVRGNSGTTLSSILPVNSAITLVFMVTQGATAYYASGFTIDGTSVTPKWQGGTAPAAGNASSIDAYTYTIVKTAATPTYTVFASQTKFA